MLITEFTTIMINSQLLKRIHLAVQ